MHSFARHLHGEPAGAPGVETHGRILNWGWRYDLMEWFGDTFVLRGKIHELRWRTADLARIQPGDTVLDVGCGTGTLAIDAARLVGATGRVVGIDPGPQQIARARAKATRHHLPIEFQIGVIERLPFPDQTFDVVLSTIMMHHLPDDLKRAGLAEIARVLKQDGRLAIADFLRSEENAGQSTDVGAGAHGIQELPELIGEAGLARVELGEELRFPRIPHLHGSGVGFVRAIKP